MRTSFSGLKMVKMSVFKPHGFSTMCCSLSLSLYLNMRVYIPSLHSDHSTLLFNTVQINHNVSASVWKEPVASGQVTHYEVRSAGQGWVCLVLVTLSSRLFSVHNSARLSISSWYELSWLFIMWPVMVVSSTHWTTEFSWRLMQSQVFSVNRRGLSMQPWGAPVLRTNTEKVCQTFWTVWGLFMYPNADCWILIFMCEIVSNTEQKSTNSILM